MTLFKKIKQVSEERLKQAVDSIKESQQLKSYVMEKVVEVDYSKSLTFLEENQDKFPKTPVLISILKTLQEASVDYKSSNVENKNELFFKHIYNTIDAEKAIDELEPIVNFVPYGNIIMIILKYIIKKAKDE